MNSVIDNEYRNEDGPFPMRTYEPTAEADLIIDYIRQRADSDQPWCIMMSCQAPHSTGLLWEPLQGFFARDPCQRLGCQNYVDLSMKSIARNSCGVATVTASRG